MRSRYLSNRVVVSRIARVARRLSQWAACTALAFLAVWALSTARTEAQQRRPQVIELEEIKIEGRVQKPNAFYILNRANLGYEVLDLRSSFVREIIRSVRHEPF